MNSLRILVIAIMAFAASTMHAFNSSNGMYVYQQANSSSWGTDVPGLSRAYAKIDASSMSSANKTALKNLLSTAYNNSKFASGQPRTSPSTYTASSGSLSVTVSNSFQGGPFPGPNYYDAYGLGEDAKNVMDIVYLYMVSFSYSGPDNNAPSASISAPSGTVRANSASSWPISGSDSDGNLSGYRVYLNGSSAPGWTSVSGSSFNTNFSFTPSTAGTYTLRIDVRDSAGATATSTASKTVDPELVYHTLSVSRNTSSGGNVSGAGTFLEGTNAPITATPASGWKFDGWTGSSTSSSTSTTVYMNGPKSVTANFSRITYSLSVGRNTSSGGTVSGAGTYNSGSTASFSASPASGWKFDGWSGDSTSSSTSASLTMNGNRSVTANFSRITYSLSVGRSPSSGGTVSGAGTYNSGSTASFSASPATGYTFTGWSGDSTSSSTSASLTMNGNRSVTANFSLNNYTLTTNRSPSAGGSVTAGGTQAYGTTKSITATPATGYTFTGWSGSASGSTNPLNVSFTTNKTITANFTLGSFSVTASTNPPSLGTVSGAGTYTYGATATLTAPNVAGYTFTGWSGDASGSANPVNVSVTSNRAVIANYSLNSYPVSATASPAAGGSVSGAGTYNHGQTATITASPNSAYNFTGWSGDASGSTNPLSVNVTGSRSITANFALKTYTVTTAASPAAGGSVSGAGTYTHGQSASVTATPATGYDFTGWTGSATGTTNPASLSMTANRSVTANFALKTYTLSTGASPGAGGSVSGAGTYTHGQNATVTATPATGYTFSGWSGSASGSTNPLSVAMDGNKTVTANFTLNTYALTTNASPAIGGSVSGGGTYNHGDNASLTATPAPGYSFAGWTGDASGSTNPLTVAMTSAKSITATFSLIPPPTASISASKTSGWTPVASTLTWSSTNAASVTVSGPSFTSSNSSGSQLLNLTGVGSYTYTITATNANGSASDAVTIQVEPSTFTLSTGVNGSGAITPGGTYPRPNPSVTAVTITATPTSTTMFSTWSGDTSSTVSNPQSDGSVTLYVPMTQDRSIIASFVSKLSQTISFPNPGTRNMKNGSFSVSATASSGLPVTIAVTSGPASISGNVVTLTGEGSVTLTAYQSGNTVYLPASPVSVSFQATNPVQTHLEEDKADSSINNGESEETNFGTN